ncbi:unnamed protein product [Prorocentrum cordatum]|uniref:Uncharacterized protein n=1 Tax=Prorocentrum cordatum TaxID=2364126 RepID=A0ABN9XY12_9DINO|nr:unnamed protein product [Polarella glacialis]
MPGFRADAPTGTGGLRAGDRVAVRGLLARPDLNGATGRLHGWNVETSRWNVVTDAGLGLSLSALHLEACGGGAAGGPGGGAARGREADGGAPAGAPVPASAPSCPGLRERFHGFIWPSSSTAASVSAFLERPPRRAGAKARLAAGPREVARGMRPDRRQSARRAAMGSWRGMEGRASCIATWRM